MLSKLNSVWQTNETLKYELIVAWTWREFNNIHKKFDGGEKRVATKNSGGKKKLASGTENRVPWRGLMDRIMTL